MIDKLVVAVSSRALFDLSESNAVFEQLGVDAYAAYQIEHENKTLEPGPGFRLVQKLLAINRQRKWVEVILLSRNSADTGLRIFNSIQHYQLDIARAAFSAGQSPYPYIPAFQAHLFLSVNPEDVACALQAGCAAATLLPHQHEQKNKHVENSNLIDQVRIAFDGDAVIFSTEAEKIFQQEGLAAFTSHETAFADQPLHGGPFKGFLAVLHQLQKEFPPDNCPIRTALVTARQAPAHKRVIQTLRSWSIRIDEALFLGGLEKSEFLEAFQADIFFDDQQIQCESANRCVAAAHVPNAF